MLCIRQKNTNSYKQFNKEVSMKKLIMATALTVITSMANAQSNNFVGAYAGIDLNLRSSTAKLSTSNDDGSSGSFDGLGRQSINGTLDFGYNYKVDNKIVVGLGGTYDLNNTTLAKASGTDSAGETSSISLKEKNHYSVYVAPGYKISEGTLAYGKLSYHNSKVADSTGELNEKVHGLGYGAGIKTMIDKNMYFKVEVQRVDYRDLTIVSGVKGSTGTTIGTIGIGYNF